MSISSLSSITSGNTGYDFTNMTSRQAIAAAGDLSRKGVITGDQFAILAGSTPALSSVPINGNQAGGPNPMDSTTDSDYFKVLQDSIKFTNSLSGKDEAETNGLHTSESLLSALSQYQYGTAGGFQQSGTHLSTQA